MLLACLFFFFFPGYAYHTGLLRWLNGEESTYNAGDVGSIPASGRSSGGGNGNPLQYSCLEIPWTDESDRLQSIESPRVRHH